MPTGRYFTQMPEGFRPQTNLYLNVYYSGTTETANIIILGDNYATVSARGKCQASNKMTTSNSYFLSLNGISYLTD